MQLSAVTSSKEMLLSVLFALCQRWMLAGQLRPEEATLNLFGRSVGFCPSTQRIVVGAEWENSDTTDRAGALYIFDYNREKRSWHQSAVIKASDIELEGNFTAKIRSLGSTVQISSDCRTIIAGAPMTDYVNNVNGDAAEEVGSVLLYEEVGKKWQIKNLMVPHPMEIGGGYGRTLAASSDLKFYSAAYFNKAGEGSEIVNKVLVSMEVAPKVWSEPESLDPPVMLDLSSFGGNLQFIDASTLLVGSKEGAFIYKKTEVADDIRWEKRREIVLERITELSDKYTSFGEHVTMPENDQTLLAISAQGPDGDGIVFVTRDDVTNTWEYSYDVPFPAGWTGIHLDFCKNIFLAATGQRTTDDRTESAVFLFHRNKTGMFHLAENVTQPSEDRDRAKHLNFVSSFAWDNDHCSRFVVGSMSKDKNDEGEHIPYEFSKAYVYQSNIRRERRGIERQIKTLSVLGSIFFVGLIGAIIVAVLANLYMQFRKRRQAAQITDVNKASREVELL